MTPIEDFVAELARLDVRLWAEGQSLRCSAPDHVLTEELRAQLVQRKAELLAFLERARTAVRTESAGPVIDRVDRGGPIPLSPGQERLWSLSGVRPHSSVYHISTAFLLDGPIDVAALEAALSELQARHESLRTTIAPSGDSALQSIGAAVPVALKVMDIESDLRRLSPERRRQEVGRLLQSEVVRPFDLVHGPLWRPLLLRLTSASHVLSLTMHHLIFDGGSKAVFLEEIGEIYTALTEGREPRLEPLPLQYADFASWQHRRLAGEPGVRQLEYWRQRFRDGASALRVPNDRPRAGAASSGFSRPFEFPVALADAVGGLARSCNASMYVVLLAAFNALLHRYSGQCDLLVCSPLAARDRAEFERLVGYFNNIVVMRSDLSGDPEFIDLVGRVRRSVLEALEHQNVPLQEVAALPGLVRVALNRAMFSYQDTSSRTLKLPGVVAHPFDVRKDEADFELAMYMERDGAGRLAGVLEYDAGLFEESTIDKFLDNFRAVLESVANDPGRRLSELPGDYPGPELVEGVLNGSAQIDQAVVVASPAAGGAVAYLVLNEYDVPDLEDIRRLVKERVPDFLTPAAYVPLDTIPLCADGRVDVDALPAPGLARGPGHAGYVAPRTDLEHRLAAIWQRVLWLDDEVGVEDDFADLGGHSLLSVQLVAEVEKELGRELPPAVLYELRTVARMASMLEAEPGPGADGVAAAARNTLSPEIYQGLLKYTASWSGHRARADSLIVGMNVEGARPALYWCLQRYGELTQLAKYLGEEQPVFGMRSGNRVMVRSQANIEALAARYVEEILDMQGAGPYIIGGNCQAAKIAFQVARQIGDRGGEIALLILMEKFVPLPYGGRIALVFSADSDRNPYLDFREPERGWRKYYSGPITLDMISGRHGEFFREPNIQVLTEAIGRRLHEARESPPTGAPAPEDEWQRLPDEAYRAHLRPRGPASVAAGEVFRISVDVANAGAVPWRPGPQSGIVVAGRWLDNDGMVVRSRDGGTLLDRRLEPGARHAMELEVTAPERPGSYLLDVDLVDEGISWFSAKGSVLSRLAVTVA